MKPKRKKPFAAALASEKLLTSDGWTCCRVEQRVPGCFITRDAYNFGDLLCCSPTRGVMLVQVKLAEGFNLQNATDMLFLGRDWAPAKNWQAEGRCHRMGVAGTVNVQIPIMHKTVEVFLDRKLDAKDADAQQAMAKVTPRELLEAL